MNKKKTYSILLTILLISSYITLFIPQGFSTGSLGNFVDYSTTNISLMYSTQRKIGYDGTYWWADYNNGTQHEISYSSDAVTWHSAGAVWNSSFTEDSEVKIYGSSIIYACTMRFVGGVFVYTVFRTGNISGTSITWGGIKTVYAYGGVPRANYACSVAYDGTSYVVSWSNPIGAGVDDAYISTNKGVTWANPLQSPDNTVGSTTLPMTAGKFMVIRRLYSTVIPANTQGKSYIWSGVAWGGGVQINTDKIGSNPGGAGITDQDGSFSAVSDGINADIVHLAYLNRTGNSFPYTYNIAYVYYQTGWQPAVNVQSGVTSTSQPNISYDDVEDSVIVAWTNNSLAYQKTFYFHGNASWGTTSIIGNPSSPIPQYLIASGGRHNFKINYLIENGGGLPWNVTVLTLSFPTPPPPPPAISGKLCGNSTNEETNTSITEIPKLISVMCVNDFGTGAIINRTGFYIRNYTNQFMSAWATLSIYTGNDGHVISNEHPLKLIWQKTYEVRNNTNNQLVEYYPNLFIPDHNYVAIAFSSTEDIGLNTTVSINTQYTVNQYAPTTVSFLQSSTYKAMFYAYWYRQNVTFAGDNSFAVQDTAFIAIPSNIQAFWISVGMPPQAGGFIILIAGIIMLAIVVLTKGVDEPEKVIGILGITAILCASAVNLIPVEIGIAVMIFVAAYFAMKIYGRMAGGSGE